MAGLAFSTIDIVQHTKMQAEMICKLTYVCSKNVLLQSIMTLSSAIQGLPGVP